MTSNFNKSCLRTIQLAYRGLRVTKPAYYNYSMTPKRSMCNFNSTAHKVSEMSCTQRFYQDSKQKIISPKGGIIHSKLNSELWFLVHKMTLYAKNHNSELVCEVSKQQHTQCLSKELARKGLTKNSKSKRERNSIKIQFRVMVLDKQGRLIILYKYVKFQSNSIHSV